MEIYEATDRRVYNGAYCTDMQKQINNTKYLEERMLKADATASCTYFPVEGKYMTFTNCGVDAVGPPYILTNNFHENKQSALIEAIEILEGVNK